MYRATRGDYATVPAALAEDVATSNPEPSIRVSHNFVCASLRLVLLALGGLRFEKTVINCFFFTHIPTKRSIDTDAPFSLSVTDLLRAKKGFKTEVLNPF